jgi:hypothetical protein
MQTKTRTLLMAAVAAVLLTPVAHAQNIHAQGIHAQGHAATQVQAPMAPPTLPPTANDAAQDAMEMTKPVRNDRAQGAVHAASHSEVVTRDVFSRLDTDGDGRISTAEAALDVDFNTTVPAMDADGDGFVTEAEYRAHAKADMP